MGWFGTRSNTRPDISGLSERLSKAEVVRVEKLLDMLAADDTDLRAKREVADLWEKAGRREQALEMYCDLVEAFATSGLLLKAIATCRQILTLDPAHQEAQRRLAALVLQQEDRRQAPRAADAEGSEPLILESADLTSAEGESEPAVLAAADLDDDLEDTLNGPRAAGSDEATLAPPPMPRDSQEEHSGEISAEELLAVASMSARAAPSAPPPTRVPFFSGLSEASFVALLPRLKVWEAEPDAVILAEGEPGESAFVVVKGRVRVERQTAEGPTPVAELADGSFFGEMALLDPRPRTASVVAMELTELLEIGRAELDAIAAADPTVNPTLRRFVAQRTLDGVARTSPLFSGLPKPVLAHALAGFVEKRVVPHTTLITQGEESPGLFVVLHGTLDVSAVAEMNMTIRLKQLRAGDVFGEMSILSGAPAAASVVAATDATVLFLPRAHTAKLAAAHPSLKQRLEEIAVARRAMNARFLPEASHAGTV